MSDSQATDHPDEPVEPASAGGKRRTDFFVSYTANDRAWAEWIAWQLESAGHTTMLQEWDFGPGTDFVHEMQQATTTANRTIAVLSSAYFSSRFGEAEWRVAFAKDPTGEQNLLIPVRVEDVAPIGLLSTRVYIDLVGRDAAEARDALLRGIDAKGARPTTEPRYPGAGPTLGAKEPGFPGTRANVWNVPREPNPIFTGRDKLIGELEAKLRLESWTQGPKRIVLYGLGGVGKTQLAVEYVYRRRSAFDIVWWVRSEEGKTLAGDFAALAEDLDLPEHTNPDHNLAIGAVQRWLDAHSQWLLVFDNADDPRILSRFLPSSGGGRVLITSRNPVWRRYATAMLEIPVLTLDDAVDFLLARSGDDNRQAARAVAEQLGQLPLALEQAGAYVEETGVSVSGYLKKLRQYPQEVFAEGRPPDYEATVLTTWQLSFENIRKKSVVAVELLNLCAYLSPDEIPEALFQDGRDALPTELANAVRAERLDQAIAVPRHYSLVRRGGGNISLHRLVQDAIRGQLDADQQRTWATEAVHLVDRVYPADSSDVRTWEACQQFLPHVMAVADHSEELQVAREELSWLLDRAAVYLRLRGHYQAAKETYERVLAIDEVVYGNDHPNVSADLNNLGSVLQDLGELTHAKERYAKALAIDAEFFGQDHPRVAIAMNNLGSVVQEGGDLLGARGWLEQALEVRENAVESNDPEIVVTLNNLGSIRQDLGELDRAREIFQKVLEIRLTTDDPTNANVAAAKNNLGSILHDLGQLTDARSMLEDALQIREMAFGPLHPSLGAVHSNLGMVLHDLGLFEMASDHYRQALEIEEAAYGEQHPNVATDLNNIGSLHHELGQLDEAKAMLERALAIREVAHHPDHPGLATVLNNIGSLYQDLGDLSQARQSYLRALRIREATRGPEHLWVSFVLSNYGTLLCDLREFDRAREVLDRALAIQQRTYGKDHPCIAATLNSFGRLQRMVDHPDEAKNVLERALKMYQATWGDGHRAVATVLVNLAAVLADLGDTHGAASAYREAIKALESAYGLEHPSVVAAKDALAGLCPGC
jgi:tetratricopeptide (TPR) repeat protein